MSEALLYIIVAHVSQRSNAGITASIIPALSTTLYPNTPYDWNYTTTPQVGFKGRAIQYARGKVLGGSTTISKVFLNRA